MARTAGRPTTPVVHCTTRIFFEDKGEAVVSEGRGILRGGPAALGAHAAAVSSPRRPLARPGTASPGKRLVRRGYDLRRLGQHGHRPAQALVAVIRGALGNLSAELDATLVDPV